MILAPVRSSASRESSRSATGCWACKNTTPPPGTMPSSRAARVAESASSTRCFFSLSSVSVAAPTLMTATPQLVELGVLQLEAELLGYDLAASKDSDVLQHPLAPVPKARSLYGGRVE